MAEAESRFKPPFDIGSEIYRLSPEERAEYFSEMDKWLKELDEKQGPPKDFSRITAENFRDLVDDIRDEISPEQREALKQDILAGRVAGFIDDDGTMHLGQGPVVRRPSDG